MSMTSVSCTVGTSTRVAGYVKLFNSVLRYKGDKILYYSVMIYYVYRFIRNRDHTFSNCSIKNGHEMNAVHLAIPWKSEHVVAGWWKNA